MKPTLTAAPKVRRSKPFVKWAGGKQALSAEFVSRFPAFKGTYYEPFVGGGSTLFELAPRAAVVNDDNWWLIEAFLAIRDNWEAVAAALDSYPNTKADFLRIRQIDPGSRPRVERAAQLIYLNKTCFRGLFRVNRKGQFNVPYGNYRRRYYDPENLAAVSQALRSVEIRHGDFELGVDGASQGDFLYFDPPYYRLGGHSDFNRYTRHQFRQSDHHRLAAVCRELDRHSVGWMLSNSNTAFVRELFCGFRIVEVNSRREINLSSKDRNIKELLIANW
ncbi:DNA adenine methylase [Planctomycetota bacterium]